MPTLRKKEHNATKAQLFVLEGLQKEIRRNKGASYQELAYILNNYLEIYFDATNHEEVEKYKEMDPKEERARQWFSELMISSCLSGLSFEFSRHEHADNPQNKLYLIIEKNIDITEYKIRVESKVISDFLLDYMFQTTEEIGDEKSPKDKSVLLGDLITASKMQSKYFGFEREK